MKRVGALAKGARRRLDVPPSAGARARAAPLRAQRVQADSRVCARLAARRGVQTRVRGVGGFADDALDEPLGPLGETESDGERRRRGGDLRRFFFAGSAGVASLGVLLLRAREKRARVRERAPTRRRGGAWNGLERRAQRGEVRATPPRDEARPNLRREQRVRREPERVAGGALGERRVQERRAD